MYKIRYIDKIETEKSESLIFGDIFGKCINYILSDTERVDLKVELLIKDYDLKNEFFVAKVKQLPKIAKLWIDFFSINRYTYNFEYKIYGKIFGFDYSGYIDALEDDLSLDCISIVENKTISKFDEEDILQKLPYDKQLCLYIVDVTTKKRENDNRPIKINYRNFIKPMIKPLKNESPSIFGHRFYETIDTDILTYFNEISKPVIFFRIDEFLDEFKESCTLLEKQLELNMFPKNSSACNIYNKCEYFDICYKKG